MIMAWKVQSSTTSLTYSLNLNKDNPPTFFVVGGRDTKAKISREEAKTGSVWYSVRRKDIATNEGGWNVIDSMTK